MKSVGDGIIDFLSEVHDATVSYKKAERMLFKYHEEEIGELKQKYRNIATDYSKYLMEYLEYIKPAMGERDEKGKGPTIPEGWRGQVIYFNVTVSDRHPEHAMIYTAYRFDDELKECSIADRLYMLTHRVSKYANKNMFMKMDPECCMRSGKYIIVAPAYIYYSPHNILTVSRDDKHEMILNIERLTPPSSEASRGYSWTFPIDKDDFDLFVAEKYMNHIR